VILASPASMRACSRRICSLASACPRSAARRHRPLRAYDIPVARSLLPSCLDSRLPRPRQRGLSISLTPSTSSVRNRRASAASSASRVSSAAIAPTAPACQALRGAQPRPARAATRLRVLRRGAATGATSRKARGAPSHGSASPMARAKSSPAAAASASADVVTGTVAAGAAQASLLCLSPSPPPAGAPVDVPTPPAVAAPLPGASQAAALGPPRHTRRRRRRWSVACTGGAASWADGGAPTPTVRVPAARCAVQCLTLPGRDGPQPGCGRAALARPLRVSGARAQRPPACPPLWRRRVQQCALRRRLRAAYEQRRATSYAYERSTAAGPGGWRSRDRARPLPSPGRLPE